MRNSLLLILLALSLTSAAWSQTPTATAPRDIAADTWVTTDGLGRSVPTEKETGLPRRNKTVGMFYFLTFDHSQDALYDNTKILKAHPEAATDVHDPAWGPLNSAHYWGEPLFGYYASDDEWALRKHAQMLSDAGVDVVIIDNSNAVTYDKARNTLCRVWEDVRRKGGRTPQIAFLCPFSNWNHIGGSTLRELYDTLYKPKLYSDLWFRWEGKPLILADQSYSDPIPAEALRVPTPLQSGQSLGQTFTAERPFTEVGGEFPTWGTTGSGVTVSLYAKGPGGPLLARRTLTMLVDNAVGVLKFAQPLPTGTYYFEISYPLGRVGWWGSSISDVHPSGQAFDTGTTVPGARSLRVRFSGDSEARIVSPSPTSSSPASEAQTLATTEAQTLRNFFTFRAPIAPYNIKSPPPGQWAWLQVYPQSPQLSPSGTPEQITVGVAQNYNAAVNNTAPMSFPGAFGRSYHDGKLDTRPDAGVQGYNFGEQWGRALKIDPPFVFMTGWNEWTAGFYDNWAGYHGRPIFVDEYTAEFSRDIEPMMGGFGDDYYYQMVDNVRRYKGSRPVPPVSPRPIPWNGSFDAWQHVTPEFRDDIGDTAHRASIGTGKGLHYVNTSGRNDIVAAKVSYDVKNLYFYVRTHAKLTPHTDKDWMLLYLNTDTDYKTGWLGYDFVVNRQIGAKTTSLEKNVGGKYAWQAIGEVKYVASGSQLVIAIPRRLLGPKALKAIDFKWADHCFAKGDWTDFTLNGDAAPNDRFNYRAEVIPHRRGQDE